MVAFDVLVKFYSINSLYHNMYLLCATNYIKLWILILANVRINCVFSQYLILKEF